MTPNQKSRQFFQNRIFKGMIGPGSDILSRDDDAPEEIISDYPLIRYFSAVLFPDKTPPKSQAEVDADEIESLSVGEEEPDVDADLGIFDEEEETSPELKKVKNSKEEPFLVSSNNFFPSNMGLTFCVPKGKKNITAFFEFGIYQEMEKDFKIAMNETDFHQFSNHPTFPFKELVIYKNGYLVLKRKLKGNMISPRTEEYKALDDFKRSAELKNSSLNALLPKFESLTRRLWQRTPHRIKQEIPIENDYIGNLFYRKISKSQEQDIKFRIKTYTHEQQNPGKQYVKIQLINDSKHPSNRFSNKNKNFNLKCIFQSKIMVQDADFKPYRSFQDLNPYDEEAGRLDYLYREVKSFGIGHNCAFEWDNAIADKPAWVATTFLPEYNVLDTRNSFKKEEFDEPNVFDIYDLSVFSKLDKSQIISRLQRFILFYEEWLEKEKKQINGGSYQNIETEIIQQITENLDRLFENLQLLSTNDKVFQAFSLANTAMLIQIILSNDDAFGGNEKDILETQKLQETIDYDSLDFFKNYDFNRLPFHRPKYRPFQLAFLLLNLKGIIDENSKSRKEIVDLIWFPTGGGKTEAYLAVTAFTIIWRRLNFLSTSKGTAVIMRYTLRLLTAQQFERASRLVVALDFLRQKNIANLGEEPISIGLWVGMASTPNSRKDAAEKIEAITEEINKTKNNGNPESKNVFQISACPWCGTRLISKNKYGNWKSGFGTEKGHFKICCNNKKCHFHQQIPVQVVDEELYDAPPTILFATVDKFAQLAWVAKGHRFFNTQNDDLPPDLIIQDELHLLTDLTHPFFEKSKKGEGILDRTSVLLKNGTKLFYFYLSQKRGRRNGIWL